MRKKNSNLIINHSSFFPEKKIIKVGRAQDCDIQIDSNDVSKYQCLIYYRTNNWAIADGDGKNGSRNGTWLFADELFLIYNNMVIKAGQTLFKANLIYNKKKVT